MIDRRFSFGFWDKNSERQFVDKAVLQAIYFLQIDFLYQLRTGASTHSNKGWSEALYSSLCEGKGIGNKSVWISYSSTYHSKMFCYMLSHVVGCKLDSQPVGMMAVSQSSTIDEQRYRVP